MKQENFNLGIGIGFHFVSPSSGVENRKKGTERRKCHHEVVTQFPGAVDVVTNLLQNSILIQIVKVEPHVSEVQRHG